MHIGASIMTSVLTACGGHWVISEDLRPDASELALDLVMKARPSLSFGRRFGVNPHFGSANDRS
jgi:hypothetical protein